MKISLVLLLATSAQAIGMASKGDGAMVTGSQVTSDGKRWIPTKYSTDSDDQLMRNLIEQGLAYTKDSGFKNEYQFKAKEGCGATAEACMCCMEKHTHFWIDREGAFAAAKEIVKTNLHFSDPAKVDQFLADNFEYEWKKVDVMQSNWVEVERMASFYKNIMGDVTISIQ